MKQSTIDNPLEPGASAPAPATSPARSKQMRGQILQAAYTCLEEVGFENITTRRIADAAGVNIATLHYYFGTKEALLRAAIMASIEESERALRLAADAAPDAASALEAVLHAAWERVHRRQLLRYDLVVRGLRSDEARADAQAVYAVYRRLTQEILERHVADGGTLADHLTTEQAAQYMISIIDGVVLHYTLTEDEAAARRGLDLIQTHIRQLMHTQLINTANGAIQDEQARF